MPSAPLKPLHRACFRYIERTQTILIYCSDGYIKSKNCMIEIRSTVKMGKPIIPVLDPDKTRGGLTKEQIREQLIESDGKWEKWGFNTDGLGEAKGEQLYNTLFSFEPIDWNRIGAFQDVSMRLIANRLLPTVPPYGHRPLTYIKGELIQTKIPLGPPSTGKRFHVYCSANNAGSTAIMRELACARDLKIEVVERDSDSAGTSRRQRSSRAPELGRALARQVSSRMRQASSRMRRSSGSVGSRQKRDAMLSVTEHPDDLTACDYFLVYLHGETITAEKRPSTHVRCHPPRLIWTRVCVCRGVQA